MDIGDLDVGAQPEACSLRPEKLTPSYDLLNTVLGRIQVPVWVFDIDRCAVAWANTKALQLWRADTLHELCTRDFASDMSITVAEKLRQYQLEFKQSDATFSEIWTHYPKGVPSTIRVKYSGIPLRDGRMAMLCEGGSEIKETPEKLRSAEALVHTPVMITLHDYNGTILYRNPAAKTMETTSGGPITEHFVHLADLTHLRLQLSKSREAQGVAEVHTSRGIRFHEITARYCIDPVTGSEACLWSEVDVTEIKQAESQALYDASHDPLTQLPNRTFVQTVFEERLQTLLSTQRQAALLFVDLDRFFLVAALSNVARNSTPSAIHFVCIDKGHVRDLLEAADTVYAQYVDLVVWNKTNAGQGGLYRQQHELIGVFRTGGEPHRNNVQLGKFGRNRSNVWTYPGVNTFRPGRMADLAVHPTVKPTRLVADALKDVTKPGDLVLDTFVGSGTTILAAEQVGRRCRAMDFSPKYAEVAIRRWEAMTGRDAVLAETGQTLGELAISRAAPVPRVRVRTRTPTGSEVGSKGKMADLL